MRHMKKVVVVAALAVVGVVAVALGGGGTTGAMAFTENILVLQEVARGDIRESITAAGLVELGRVEPIYSSAHGETRLRVAQVLVEVGDVVEIGDTIVTYDIEEELISLQGRIRDSEINLENERLNLVSRTLGPTPTERVALMEGIHRAEEGIRTAEEAIVQAHNTLLDGDIQLDTQAREIEQARRAYEQAVIEASVSTQLLALGGITQFEYDNLQQDVLDSRQNVANQEQELINIVQRLEAAQREYEAAHRGLEASGRELDSARLSYNTQTQPLSTQQEQIEHTRAHNTLALSQAAHDSLLEERDRLTTQTTAHTAGTVIAVEVTQGAQVTGTSKLVDVADFSNLIVTSEIREFDAPRVYVGQRANMTVDGLPGVVYTGSVVRISPIAQSRQAMAGTEIVVPIEISVDNPDEQLRPGYSVNVELVLFENQDVLSIPLMSIMHDPDTGESYVFIVEGDTIRRRTIGLGLGGGLDQEVVSGLEDGDVIVLTPTPDMQDGDPVPEDAVMGGGMLLGPGPGTGGGTGGGGGTRVIRPGGGGGGVVIRG